MPPIYDLNRAESRLSRHRSRQPYKPTTQGKNERFHQTLFRYLDKQPWVESLAELRARATRSTTPATPNSHSRDCRRVAL